MSVQLELDPVGRITAAAVGPPGERTFFLQARKEEVLVSLLMEKQQVALLSAHIDELLSTVGEPEPDAVLDPGALDLEDPVVAEFRIGRIGLGYDEARDLFLIQCDEYVASDEEEGDAPQEPPVSSGRVRLWATREQMHALARRGESEVGAGRATCSMCGQPIEPAGHFCPRSNGHREVTRLA